MDILVTVLVLGFGVARDQYQVSQLQKEQDLKQSLIRQEELLQSYQETSKKLDEITKKTIQRFEKRLIQIHKEKMIEDNLDLNHFY